MDWMLKLTSELKVTSAMLRVRQDEFSNCNDRLPDDCDAASALEYRAVAHSDLKRLASQKHDLEVAMQRLEDGDFGWCEECGTEIPEKRLLLKPSTSHCVECQHAIEVNEKHFRTAYS